MVGSLAKKSLRQSPLLLGFKARTGPGSAAGKCMCMGQICAPVMYSVCARPSDSSKVDDRRPLFLHKEECREGLVPHRNSESAGLGGHLQGAAQETSNDADGEPGGGRGWACNRLQTLGLTHHHAIYKWAIVVKPEGRLRNHARLDLQRSQSERLASWAKHTHSKGNVVIVSQGQ